MDLGTGEFVHNVQVLLHRRYNSLSELRCLFGVRAHPLNFKYGESIMYFIEQVAVYRHGVYWIGEDLAEGVHKLLLLARDDIDSHHNWVLAKYSEDFNNEVLIIICKDDGKRYRVGDEIQKLETELGKVYVVDGLEKLLENWNGDARYVCHNIEEVNNYVHL